MERSLLIVAATHRAAQIRDHFHQTGCRLVETTWEGRGKGRCFELPPAADVRGFHAPFLYSVRAGPFDAEIPVDLRARLAGPLSGIAERLSGALRVDVLVVYASDNPESHVVVVWVEGATERVHLASGGAWREWPAPWPQVSQIGAERSWEDEVEVFLTTRPISQSPGGGGADLGDLALDFVTHVALNSVARPLLGHVSQGILIAAILTLVGLVWVGRVVGERFGHGDLGAAVVFVAVLVASAVGLWRSGVVRLPARSLSRLGWVGGSGVLLVLAGRALESPLLTAAVGGSGMVLVLLAGLWACCLVAHPHDDPPAH